MAGKAKNNSNDSVSLSSYYDWLGLADIASGKSSRMCYKHSITSSTMSEISGMEASIMAPSFVCLCSLNPNAGL